MQCANNVEVILNFLIPSCSCGNYTYNTFFSTHQSVGSSYLSFKQFGISQRFLVAKILSFHLLEFWSLSNFIKNIYFGSNISSLY